MTDPSSTLAICDANILIDYTQADEDILRELAEYWKDVIVPDIVLDEVAGLSEQRALELGLRIELTPLAELKPHPALSPQDCACLYFTKEHDAVCLTNDKALRRSCTKEGYRVVWGLEMLLLLFQNNQIKKSRICDMADRIARSNPEIGLNLITEFKKKLESFN